MQTLDLLSAVQPDPPRAGPAAKLAIPPSQSGIGATIMERSISRLFESRKDAKLAVSELQRTGVDPEAIGVASSEQGCDARRSVTFSAADFPDSGDPNRASSRTGADRM